PTFRAHALMPDITHSQIPVNGIEMHVAECGKGPLVLMCHGWPELWYSWRHQLAVLHDAGFHAVAPDMRGFGRTTAPQDVARYTIKRLFHIGFGDTPREDKMSLYVDRAKGFIGAVRDVALPPWLSEADLDVFATEYRRTGFRGGLNWYRNIDRNWELTAPWH